MTSFDERNNDRRNKHINKSCNPVNSGASAQACRIGHALFHLDGLARVVDDDREQRSGFVASCCRVIERELKADTAADDPTKYAFEETRLLLARLRHLQQRENKGPEFATALEAAHQSLLTLLVFF